MNVNFSHKRLKYVKNTNNHNHEVIIVGYRHKVQLQSSKNSFSYI